MSAVTKVLPAAIALHDQRRQEFGDSRERYGAWMAHVLCQVREGLPDRSDDFFIEAMEILQMDEEMTAGFLQGLRASLTSEYSFEDGVNLAINVCEGKVTDVKAVVTTLRERDEQFCCGFVHVLANEFDHEAASGEEVDHE